MFHTSSACSPGGRPSPGRNAHPRPHQQRRSRSTAVVLATASADPKNTDYYLPNENRRDGILEVRDEYTSENVFWIPVEARWPYLQDRAKQPDVGVLIDTAMDVIEKENPSLKGVLPKTYTRGEIDKRLLGELVDLIGKIGFTQVDHGADDVLGRVGDRETRPGGRGGWYRRYRRT